MANGMTFKVRQGASLARGTTIDEYLSQETCDALYEKWSPEWAEPLMFSGGIRAITCEMVVDVPKSELVKVYGKAKGNEIYAAAENNAAR